MNKLLKISYNNIYFFIVSNIYALEILKKKKGIIIELDFQKALSTQSLFFFFDNIKLYKNLEEKNIDTKFSFFST